MSRYNNAFGDWVQNLLMSSTKRAQIEESQQSIDQIQANSEAIRAYLTNPAASGTGSNTILFIFAGLSVVVLIVVIIMFRKK